MKPGIETKFDIIDAPNVVDTFKILERNSDGIKNGVLSGDLAYKIYDSTGIKGEILNDICEIFGIKFNEEDYQKKFESVRSASKIATIMNNMCKAETSEIHEKTDDNMKYSYGKIERHR